MLCSKSNHQSHTHTHIHNDLRGSAKSPTAAAYSLFEKDLQITRHIASHSLTRGPGGGRVAATSLTLSLPHVLFGTFTRSPFIG